jgi:hypothetical protein
MAMRSEPLLEGTAGFGFHYFPDTNHYCAQDLAAWMPELQALGVRWLTVQAELRRAIPEAFLAPLLEAGITPIVHIPIHPIQSLDPDDVRGLLRAYANWGVEHVVVFDRANMRESWHPGAFEQAQLPERFVDCWLPLAKAQIESGLRPVLPPLQQGGTYWDTSFLSAVLRKLISEGAQTVIDQLVLGVYSYAFANPPDWGRGGSNSWPASQPYLTPPGSQDQCGFWSFDWYAEVLMEVLGEIPPMIMLAGGARRSEIETSSGNRMGTAWHTTCNASIARAMHAGHLPDYLLNVNFWLLASPAEGSHVEDAWYPPAGDPAPATDELKRLAASSANAANRAGKSYLESLQPVKPLNHYVLLPTFEWGPSEWHWSVAGPLVREENASCGYSLEVAVEAARVTLVGDEHEIGPDVVDKLQQAGCVVTRVSGDDYNAFDSEKVTSESSL